MEQEPEIADDAPRTVLGRSARRIVIAMAVAVVALVGLTWWVVRVPYETTVYGTSVDCKARVMWDAVDGTNGDRQRTFERGCRDAEDQRRDLALLLGAGVAIAACAVSTIPSRRLTGEALGPLR